MAVDVFFVTFLIMPFNHALPTSLSQIGVPFCKVRLALLSLRKTFDTRLSIKYMMDVRMVYLFWHDWLVNCAAVRKQVMFFTGRKSDRSF